MVIQSVQQEKERSIIYLKSMSRYVPPVVNLYEKDRMDKRLRKYNRLKKLRRILGLPHKNMYISPGVYVLEHDFTLLRSSK
jgi:hypothetical protein